MSYHTKLYLIVISARSAKALGIMFADYSNAFMCPLILGCLLLFCEAHTTVRAWWKVFYYVVNLVQ